METADQISALLEAISEKERILAAKKEVAAALSVDYANALEDAEKIDELLASAQEEWYACERERADVVNQFNACQQNKLQHTQAEEIRREINNAETELRRADERIAELEQELQVVSESYKNERERRMLMLSKVRSMVNGLYDSIARKISVTMQEDVVEDAEGCLRVITEISREREAECRQWEKYSREASAIVQLKEKRAAELRLESEKSIAMLEDVKQQEMKRMILKCETERAALQNDIDELKEVHRRQLEQLRTAKLSSGKGGKIARSEADAPVVRSSVSVEKFLVSKLNDHQKEREELEKELRFVTSERQKAVIATRQLQQEIENDTAKHNKAVLSLENQIQNERQEIASLEKDNQHLRDLCDSLGATLRSGYLAA